MELSNQNARFTTNGSLLQDLVFFSFPFSVVIIVSEVSANLILTMWWRLEFDHYFEMIKKKKKLEGP